MTKEVIAIIRGLHFSMEDGADKIETITAAEYFCRGGCHYLVYEDLDEGSGKTTRNLLKCRPQAAELTRKGVIDVHMVFEEHKKNVARYTTPFGSVMIGIDTMGWTLTSSRKKSGFPLIMCLRLIMNSLRTAVSVWKSVKRMRESIWQDKKVCVLQAF